MKLPGTDSTRAVKRKSPGRPLGLFDTDSELSPVGIAMLSIARAGLLVSLQIWYQSNCSGRSDRTGCGTGESDLDLYSYFCTKTSRPFRKRVG